VDSGHGSRAAAASGKGIEKKEDMDCSGVESALLSARRAGKGQNAVKSPGI
jgi:hypothetical protein